MALLRLLACVSVLSGVEAALVAGATATAATSPPHRANLRLSPPSRGAGLTVAVVVVQVNVVAVALALSIHTYIAHKHLRPYSFSRADCHLQLYSQHLSQNGCIRLGDLEHYQWSIDQRQPPPSWAGASCLDFDNHQSCLGEYFVDRHKSS
jgi:hypothetical protein